MPPEEPDCDQGYNASGHEQSCAFHNSREEPAVDLPVFVEHCHGEELASFVVVVPVLIVAEIEPTFVKGKLVFEFEIQLAFTHERIRYQAEEYDVDYELNNSCGHDFP
jgi:hypothetical protein